MNGAPIDRRAAALALLEELEIGTSERVDANLTDFDQDATEIVLGFAFSDVVSRPGLDLRTREMLTIAMLASIGTAPGQLDFHMRAAINIGVSRSEIVEIVYQVAVYAGVPAAMNAMVSAKKAFRSLSE